MANVPFKTRFFWGLGSLGTISYLNIVTALIMVYLTTVVKLDAAVAGTIVFAARIVDAFCDPAMGWVSDHTRTPWGRRRPFLLLGAVVCGVSLPLLYSLHVIPSAINPAALALILLIVYSIGFTIFNVPYLTMPVEMTSDRLQRFSIMSYRVVFMMIGGLIGNAGAPYLVEQLGRDPDAYQTLGFVGGAFVGFVMLVTFAGTSGARMSERSTVHLSFAQQVRTVLDNKPFMILIGVKVLQFFAIAASASTTAFFVTVVLKQTFTLLTIFGLATTASVVISVPFWRWVGNYLTKRRALLIGVFGEILSILMWLAVTPENSIEMIAARGLFTGFTSGAILLNSQAMWLDTIDYDQQRTGLRREGMYTSVYVFVERLGYSLGPLVLGFLLATMGFDKDLPLEAQPESAEIAVYAGLVWIPIAAYAGGFVLLCFYNLPERINPRERTATSDAEPVG